MKVIQLPKGYTAIIDDVDSDLIAFKWYLCVLPEKTYVRGNAGTKRQQYLHRFIMERMIQRPINRGELVDHIDNNPFNNCRENLRLATHSQNVQNQKIHSNNTSGFKGVSFHKKRSRWQATISIKGKQKHLGFFQTLDDAYKAYCKAAKQYYGEFARLE